MFHICFAQIDFFLTFLIIIYFPGSVLVGVLLPGDDSCQWFARCTAPPSPQHVLSVCCERKVQALFFLNKSYFFQSKRKGSKILVDRLHKVYMLSVQVYVFLYIYI